MNSNLFQRFRGLWGSSMILISLALVATLTSCVARDPSAPSVQEPPLASAEVSESTRALWQQLWALDGDAFMFGHQDSLAYGVEWRGSDWQDSNEDRSDVKLSAGDYPALYGWDLGHLELNDDVNLDGVAFDAMRDWMRSAYERGGVVTISWHMTHPATGATSWDIDTGAAELLPGGRHHEELKQALDHFVDFALSLTVTLPNGETGPMPLIFRPWHEHNGDWFWWGKGPTSEEDYQVLWRFTFEYLTQTRGLNNLLFAFSPDRSRIDMAHFETSYLYGYPGDAYVDIMGIDNYWDLGHGNNKATRAESERQFVESLAGVARVAEQHGKLPAMTEGGQDTVFETDFYTDRLLKGWLSNEYTRQIRYIQVWRNANRADENKDHFYVPYPGHASANDFVEFYEHPVTLFERDLPDMYQREE